jgi:hypothetical protein
MVSRLTPCAHARPKRATELSSADARSTTYRSPTVAGGRCSASTARPRGPHLYCLQSESATRRGRGSRASTRSPTVVSTGDRDTRVISTAGEVAPASDFDPVSPTKTFAPTSPSLRGRLTRSGASRARPGPGPGPDPFIKRVGGEVSASGPAEVPVYGSVSALANPLGVRASSKTGPRMRSRTSTWLEFWISG